MNANSNGINAPVGAVRMSGRAQIVITASVAIDECAKGNYAAGIPVLEKKLTDARFTLPKRN